MYSTITDDSTLETHIDKLIVLEPRFADIYAIVGLPHVNLRDGGFAYLCKTIVSQQLSVAAADTIWQRLQAQHLINESALLACDSNSLRQCGLSKQKIRYIKSLAEHAIDYEALTQQDDATVLKTLTAVTGIGSWTAEIYLLFSLNRADIFAHNDLALQASAQEMLALPQRPTERVMRQLAGKWSPHRSAASYLLWRYYRHIKGRAGVNA